MASFLRTIYQWTQVITYNLFLEECPNFSKVDVACNALDECDIDVVFGIVEYTGHNRSGPRTKMCVSVSRPGVVSFEVKHTKFKNWFCENEGPELCGSTKTTKTFLVDTAKGNQTINFYGVLGSHTVAALTIDVVNGNSIME